MKINILALCIWLTACGPNATPDVQTALVKRGVFSEELTDEGTVRSVNSIAVSAPIISYRYGSLKITQMVNDGEEVKKGDTLIVFDPSEIKKAIMTSQQQLDIAKAEYEKIKATQDSEIEDLEADLQITAISQEISRINFDQAVYESEVTRKEISLKLESANIALVRAKEQIENKKKIQKEELFQKALNIKQLSVALGEANTAINNLFVISPAPGIAIKKDNWMTGQKWGLSDQPYSGTILIDLPDLSAMMAEVKINEVDAAKVAPGQNVEIRPDAYSDSIYSGVVETVANLAQNKDSKSKIKVFPVQIKINERSKKLLPGLTVSCKIIINETPDVLFIPLEALFRDQDVEYVYLKTASGFRRRDIKIGPVNTDFAIVTEGLNQDDEIALTDPFLNAEEGENDGAEKKPADL